jgi:uncharacterized protein YgiM (DUF1202 family)
MRENLPLHIFLFVLLIILVTACPFRDSFSAEIIYGEVISRVNLRQSPGLNGKIITGIPAGTTAVVKDQQAGWYKISVSEATYGYEGWVYGKFIKLVSVEKNPPDSQKNTEPGTIEPVPDKSSIKEPDIQHNIDTAVAALKPTAELVPEQAEKLPVVATEKPEPLNKKTIDTLEEVRTETEKTPPKQDMNSLNIGRAVSPPVEQRQEPLISGSASPHNAIMEWFRLILKFTSIMLACLAVVLSYKALQSAGDAREMVMRLKDKIGE